MVGDEDGGRYICPYYEGLYCPSECWRIGASGARIFECFHIALEVKSRANDGNSENQTATQATAEAGLHDEIGSSAVLMDSAAGAVPLPVLHSGLVHGEPTQRDNRAQVDDDRP